MKQLTYNVAYYNGKEKIVFKILKHSFQIKKIIL